MPLSGAGEWDAYVAAHPEATPFHSRAWCDAITRATGHRCHLITARDANGALIGILPLHHVRSPLFGQALVGRGFAVGGGILADGPVVAATLAHGAAAMAKPLVVPSLALRCGPFADGEGRTPAPRLTVSNCYRGGMLDARWWADCGVVMSVGRSAGRRLSAAA